MGREQPVTNSKVSRWRIIVLIVLALGLYGLVPQIKGFSSSLAVLSGAQVQWLVAALGVSLFSYVLAGLVYVCLAQRRLALGATALVQLASNFTNRLLPAGIGAIAVNFRYLQRVGHSVGQAGAIVLLNNLLGFLGNLLLLILCIVVTRVQPHSSFSLHPATWLLAVAVVLIALLAVVSFRLFKRRLHRLIGSFVVALLGYRQRPLRLLAALGASIGLTLCYALCLLACTKAVGLDLGFGAVFVSMSLGVAGATVTPTPGGLGGAEAALVASLLLYGADRPAALAAVLLYRIFTFWLPLLFGGFALVYARRRQYV